MATALINPYNSYTGNGAATEFAVSFPYLDREFVHVYLKKDESTEEELTTDDYEFVSDTVIRFPKTGSSLDVLGINDKLVIKRETPIENEYVFENQKRLFPVDVMSADDKAYQILQELEEALGRAIIVDPTSSITPEELIAEIERVYAEIPMLQIIADNIGDISDVADDLINIDAVAGILSDVTTVAGIASDVSGVATIASEVTAVNSNATNIDTVATNISDVNTVASNTTNINAVADNETNINAVVSNASNINAVASNSVNINSVATNATNINAVAGNSSNINAVSADLANIDAVAADLTNIDNASTYANLANDWANKTTGTVDGSEYSAKYYAQLAEEIYERIGTVIKIVGRVDTVDDLPSTGLTNGDCYLVGLVDAESFEEYYWLNDHWEFLGSTAAAPSFAIITGDPMDNTNLASALNGKQATLVSGTNIKTINNQSVLGSGDLSVGITATYDAEKRMLTLA